MKTILIVDDDYELVGAVTAFLESEGYRVVSASDGKAGLARLRSDRPDLVVTDFMMPCAGGGDLVAGLRATRSMSSTPVVMMSAVGREEALPPGAPSVAAFVHKPFRCEELLAEIVDLIGAGERGDRSSLELTRNSWT
jgi:DNA-binding response OmpR family regulator